MARIVSGAALIILSLFMLLGFFNADSEAGFATQGLLFLILVVAPAVGGGALIYTMVRARRSSQERIEQLRRQTQEAEVLKLALEKGGKLTVAYVMSETSLDARTAEDRLLALVTQGFGDFDAAESGTIVYSFYGMESRGHEEVGDGENNAR